MTGPTPRSGESAPATWERGDFGRMAHGTVVAGELLCDAVELRALERVLDIGTGTGNTALSAARRRGRVCAVDFSAPLLRRAEERARGERLRVRLVRGDAERLPFRDARFDVVLSTFGVEFVPDPARAVAEIARTCRPGGRAATATWASDGLLGRLLAVLHRSETGGDASFSRERWGTEASIRELLEPLGGRVAVRRRTLLVRGDSPEAAVEVWRRYFGPLNRLLAELPTDRAAALLREVGATFREFNRADDGTLLAPSDYLETVAGRR